MKTLVVYTSQTGFTKKYAGWIAEEMNADIYDLNDAKKKGDDFFAGYDAIRISVWQFLQSEEALMIVRILKSL